jgi:hypothetical protein
VPLVDPSHLKAGVFLENVQDLPSQLLNPGAEVGQGEWTRLGPMGTGVGATSGAVWGPAGIP